MTRIPHYKDIIITSFECNSCGEKNNGIQTSSIQDLGIKYELKVEKIKDLSRQIVKSDHATVIIPELDFEKPANGEKGGKYQAWITHFSQDSFRIFKIDLRKTFISLNFFSLAYLIWA